MPKSDSSHRQTVDSAAAPGPGPPTGERDEDDLLQLLRDADRPMRNVLHRAGVWGAPEEDCMQQARILIWTKRQEALNRENSIGYCCQVALFKALEHRRNIRRRAKFVALDAIDHPSTPNDPVRKLYEHWLINTALGCLKPSDRWAITLVDIQGCTAEEAAEIVGVTVAAMLSRIRRARGALKQEIEQIIKREAHRERR